MKRRMTALLLFGAIAGEAVDFYAHWGELHGNGYGDEGYRRELGIP